MKRAAWILAALAGAAWAVLAFYAVAWIMPATGGLLPLDMRPAGYTPDAARRFIAALPEEETRLALGLMRLVDTVFPILLGLLLGLLTWAASAPWRIWLRVLMLVAPAGYVMMDLGENALVAELLEGGPAGLDPRTVRLASEFTITKFVMAAASVLALLGAEALTRAQRRQ